MKNCDISGHKLSLCCLISMHELLGLFDWLIHMAFLAVCNQVSHEILSSVNLMCSDILSFFLGLILCRLFFFFF